MFSGLYVLNVCMYSVGIELLLLSIIGIVLCLSSDVMVDVMVVVLCVMFSVLGRLL